jgi:predicted MPP superfamily phosphohydrolase
VSAAARRIHPARVAAVATAVVTALGLLVGAHAYLARRLVLDPGVPDPARSALLALLAVLFASLVAAPFAERRLPPPWRRRLCVVPFAWMGILWISLVVVGASDGLLWLMGAAADPASGALVAGARAAGAATLIAAASAIGMRSAFAPPRVRRVEVWLARWPRALDGLRIVQISDLHVGPLLGRGFAEDVVERVNALDPDVVAVTGDLVDGSVARVGDDVEPFARLRARHGVFFVTGNHDVYSGGEAWAVRVRGLGLRVLRNERVEIRRHGAVFDLAGVDDHRGDWVHGSTQDLPATLAGRDPERPVVLLAHDPTTFREASRAGVDLQLSGHTHGGQIFPFGLLVRLAVPFVAGLYRRGGSWLYVSRGTGFWGPPLRLLAPAEITQLTLRAP